MNIEMSEILSDHLSSAEFNTGDQSTSLKSHPKTACSYKKVRIQVKQS